MINTGVNEGNIIQNQGANHKVEVEGSRESSVGTKNTSGTNCLR